MSEPSRRQRSTRPSRTTASTAGRVSAKLADEATLGPLRARADAIMLGEVTYDGLFFQHDSDTGRYEDLAYGQGLDGPVARVSQGREAREGSALLGVALERRLPSRRIARVRRSSAGVTLYRAFLMNKHAGGGTNLPWHQDGGNFWGLDRDPVLQIWTALDDAPLDGGCVEVVAGTHARGLATPLGGVVPKDHVERGDAESARAEAAGRGRRGAPHPQPPVASLGSHDPREAAPRLSVCYMDAATQCRRKKRAPRSFVQVW